LAGLCSLALSACGGSQQAEPQSYSERAEALFNQAEDALDSGNHTYALSLYRRVRENYELSPYAVMAELRVGDVYFDQGRHLQAAEAYRQFIQLHPSHGAVPYARYRIGMAYYEDMPSNFFLLPPPHERELGSTRLAARTLGEFLDRYGTSADPEIQQYLEEASEAYREATDRLASYDFYLAEFYLTRDRPIAAADHLRSLLEDYPDSSLTPRSLFLLARCYVELSDVETALETIRILETDFPSHDLTAEALEWMDTHGLSYGDIQ
jgi:outer membrane protein assembly factor BamD